MNHLLQTIANTHEATIYLINFGDLSLIQKSTDICLVLLLQHFLQWTG